MDDLWRQLGLRPEDIWLIMPVYNEETVIGEVVDSVRPFGYRLVVVDDCSSDRTYDLVRERTWVNLLRHQF
ncbi:MAG: glycosyltransferase, partial [Pseudomonadota bacterium]